jgi:hypothetical protein
MKIANSIKNQRLLGCLIFKQMAEITKSPSLMVNDCHLLYTQQFLTGVEKTFHLYKQLQEMKILIGTESQFPTC